mmetsp:Transcript_10949/g.31775  ORF Transcript_10949/g.31775 Transcript_10949/m.31775 type:complete len:95 (+) Transcript_10949:1379-1663(+)
MKRKEVNMKRSGPQIVVAVPIACSTYGREILVEENTPRNILMIPQLHRHFRPSPSYNKKKNLFLVPANHRHHRSVASSEPVCLSFVVVLLSYHY